MSRLAQLALAGLLAGVIQTTPAATFTVTNTDNSGSGSLRQALLDANAAPNPPHAIVFGAAFPASGVITLQSALPVWTNGQLAISGNARNPIIDGASTHPILVAGAGNQSVSVSGLRFRNGLRAAGGGCLALAVDGSLRSLSVSASRFENCRATAAANPRGGAVLWRPGSGSTVSIIGSEFLDNRTIASAPPPGQGGEGGAAFLDASVIMLENNRFVGNFLDVGTATAGGRGGAVRIQSRSGFVTVRSNEFRFNSASPLAQDGFGNGGGVDFDCSGSGNCTLEFSRNYFRGNSGQAGGAVSSSLQSGPPASQTQVNFLNNTFVNNSVINSGGAIYLFNVQAGLVHNSFAGNDGAGGAHLTIIGSAQLRLASNLLASPFSGTPCFASGNQVDFLSGHANISKQPCTIATGQSFIVYAAMPQAIIDENGFGAIRFDGDPVIVDGIGLASQAAAFCTATDIRGTARPIDGNGDGVARCDIGSFEHPAELLFGNGFEP